MENIFAGLSESELNNLFGGANVAPVNNVVEVEDDNIVHNKVYIYNKVEGLNRVEWFLSRVRESYDELVYYWEEDECTPPTFEDFLEDYDIYFGKSLLSEYATHWFSEVAYDWNGEVDENMDMHYGEDSCFGYCHKRQDLSWSNISDPYMSRITAYHGSAFKFDAFKKHVNHQFAYCGALETGYSTTMNLRVAYSYACATPPGVDSETGTVFGSTRYIYELNFKAKVIEMLSIRGAWELEPYKDLLIYCGVQAVHINNYHELVILDESLMSDFDISELEYDERYNK